MKILVICIELMKYFSLFALHQEDVENIFWHITVLVIKIIFLIYSMKLFYLLHCVFLYSKLKYNYCKLYGKLSLVFTV